MKTQAAAHVPAWLALHGAIKESLRSHAFLHQIRYAFMARVGTPAAFLDDRPAAEPARVPAPFIDRIREFGLEGAEPCFETAFLIAGQLAERTQHGRHLGMTSVKALQRIFSGPAGVCSDYAQVYLGLCTAAGIACREWGVSETLTGRGMGHTLNEIYCERRQKWILIDAYCSMHVTDRDGVLLSMTEAVDLARDGRAQAIEARLIHPGGSEPEFHSRYVDRYFGQHNLAFLLSHYDPFEQDRVIERCRHLPMLLQHASMIVSGVYQRYELYAGATGTEDVPMRLREVRFAVAKIVAGAGAAAALVLGGLGACA